MILAPTLTLNTPAGSRLDADAVAFAAASGATDVAALSDFVKGVKALGLWNSMVCWPLRSSQNAGTGTTAFSLGGWGTHNGTLVNGPTWGVNGAQFPSSNSRINATVNFDSDAVAWYAVRQRTAGNQTQSYNSLIGSGTAGNRISFICDKDGGDRFLLAHYGGSSPSATFVSDWRAILGVSLRQGANLVSRLETNNFGQETLYTGFAVTKAVQFVTIGNEPNFTTSSSNYAGTIAFAAAFPSNLSGRFPDITNLYKSTLGTGLGLP